jgi:hypothetical protein
MNIEDSKNKALEITRNMSDEEIKIKIKEKALEMIQTYGFERKKRSRFQYNMNLSLKEQYANTSLDRAKTFLHMMKKLLDNKESKPLLTSKA